MQSFYKILQYGPRYYKQSSLNRTYELDAELRMTEYEQGQPGLPSWGMEPPEPGEDAYGCFTVTTRLAGNVDDPRLTRLHDSIEVNYDPRTQELKVEFCLEEGERYD